MIRGLHTAGFTGHVRSVRSGREAIAYLMGELQYADRNKFPAPDFIILDLNMPEMSGNEFLAWMRAQPAFEKIPVIVLSGLPYTSVVSDAYKLGAKTFFVKPLESDELNSLLSLITKYWQRSILPEAGGTPSAPGEAITP